MQAFEGTKQMNTNNTSLKNQIYTSILNDIIIGVYPPDQVINEKGLMEKFSVSRAPVREALIELCNEKVLYSIPYYGYKITPVTDTDVANVKAYRSVVECGFMQEYWRKLTPDAIERLSAMVKEDMAQKEAGDAITNWNNNLRFHLAFFEIYGNQYAYNNLRSAMSMQTRAYAQARWNEWHSHIFHDFPAFNGPILEAIQENQMDRALRLLRADIISI